MDRQSTQSRVVLYIGAVLASLGMLTFAGAAIFSVIRGQQVNQQICRSTDENRRAIISILELAEERELENARSVRQAEAIAESYDEYYALVPPIRCRLGGGPAELER